LAEELEGRAIGFQDWEHEFAAVDIVISATGSPHPILDRDRLERLMAGRRPRPILLIDLAVPRDIDPAVTLLPEVFLANVDDLQSVADTATRQRREEGARCEKMIREAAAEFDGGRRFGPFALRSPAA
jgi:glutamyl-tRNA reductase